MKRKRTFRLFSVFLAVVLSITAFSMTAFASGNEETDHDGYSHTEAVQKESTNKPAVSEKEVENQGAKKQLPYEVKNNEDGTVTISIDGKEWIFDSNDRESAARIGTVVNVNSYLHLRAGAGMSETIIGHLLDGDKVKVIGQDGEWYQVVVPKQTGYVHGDYLKVAEAAAVGENGEVDQNLLAALLYQMLAESGNSSHSSTSLTSDGNLTLIDDIGSVTGRGQQFITFETKSGNTFYMIIDRNDKGDENVQMCIS